MGIFNKEKRGGISDVIRCDEQDYLVWKCLVYQAKMANYTFTMEV